MNPTQIQFGRDSFAQVQPIASEAAALFYADLFEADPALRPLFRGNMDEQGRRWSCTAASRKGAPRGAAWMLTSAPWPGSAG